ncbi:MAG TPA: hypothetical protein PKG54_19200 [Phycisphaerae bacterium]|nr:hypothetical protein [Phycisphaerae bacterium]HOL24925.1 hypothetical protein [Phycisphaerae bacterium]HPP20027.1 hypothetical protein [Phycisphaerae bacterium]HPU32464.1 hypothetical protein [Phycisphaerae bacterium]HQE43695.1 hypothetical protein [Phycisphaerae bacterium]
MPVRAERFHQVLLIISTILFSWFAMQVVHELGHVVGAWCSGGTVARVILHPWAFSRTDLSDNPHPLLVAWFGPVVGIVLPLILFAAARALRLPGWYILRFFAGFCLIANGAYLGAGSFEGAGDAGDLLRLGTPRWILWVFGVLTASAGLWLWHRLGRYFGLGPAPCRIHPGAAWGMAALLAGLVAVECLAAWSRVPDPARAGG